MDDNIKIEERKTGANSRFAKTGVSCFYEREVLNSSFSEESEQVVHLMKFSAENPRLRKAAKRCEKCLENLI